ncbi:hypothetical protein ACTGJ9_039450 [Bradyrhizobium sp. RDM12]
MALIIIAVTLSMMAIGASMISIIVDRPAANAGGISVGFDEWLEKHPHPCRNSRQTRSEIGLERPRRRILEKLGELVLDLIARLHEPGDRAASEALARPAWPVGRPRTACWPRLDEK